MVLWGFTRFPAQSCSENTGKRDRSNSTSKEEWEHFRNAAESLPDVGSRWLLDGRAELIMDSTMYPSRRMNFADREYYVPQRDKGIESYIGPLVKGRISQKYSFTISHRIKGQGWTVSWHCPGGDGDG